MEPNLKAVMPDKGVNLFYQTFQKRKKKSKVLRGEKCNKANLQNSSLTIMQNY